MPNDFDAVINAIAAKYGDLIMADNASKSANVPTQMARVSGAIREAMRAFPGHIIDGGVARKVLGTLPTTKDGCIVGHGARVFHPYDDGTILEWAMYLDSLWPEHPLPSPMVAWGGPNHDMFHVNECHSTKEAAEAAKEGA